MIIEAPYKQHDTITVKTTGSEEIVARFVEETANEITVENPLTIMATGQGIGLGPFAFTIPQTAKIKLNKTAVLFIHKTDSEMASQYVQSTTGITV